MTCAFPISIKAALMLCLIYLQVLGILITKQDNLRTIKAIKANSNQVTVVAVIDFLNVAVTWLQIWSNNETKIVDGISFDIKREISNGYIKKHISFSVDNRPLMTLQRKSRAISPRRF